MVAIDWQDEVAINRILRRADWRFLLPDPQPARSICFSNDPLGQAVAAISDTVTAPDAQPGGDCDLAVARNPARQILHAIWSSLRPGGAFYSEWYSPVLGGSTGIRRRLEAAGFTDILCYWPWPWPDRSSPAFWLPLDAPHALQYFLKDRPRLHSLTARVRSGVLERMWRLAFLGRIIVPVCAIARKPGASSPSAGLGDMIRAQFAGGPEPIKQLDLLLLCGGESRLNKLVCLAFADGEPAPRLAVKLPRVPEAAEALVREAAGLRAVQASRVGSLSSVPQVVFFQEWAQLPVLGETVLRGEPISRLVQPKNFRELALKVTDWLVDLAGSPVARPKAEWWERLVIAALNDLEPALDPDRLRNTQAILDTLGDLPLVFEQRDCSPWNILLSADSRLAVLDWESAEPDGLPVLDLTYFLTYLNFFLDRAMKTGRFRESYRAALDPGTFTGGVAAECQGRYLASLGLDMAVLRPLRLLTWLIHARGKLNRRNPTALQHSLFVSLWEEELVHASTEQ